MRVSLEWLRDYVDFDRGGAELAQVLTESLTETEYLGAVGEGVRGIVAARVVTCERHPDADSLSVCVVDWGEGSSTVVCGAPNARAGMTSVLALPGAVLKGGFEVSERTIRGRRSHGMLASAAELGLEDSSDGILELDGVAAGDDVAALLGLGDEIIELDVQPNRPDCLGVIGVAREVAAALDAEFRPRVVGLTETGPPVEGLASVEIEDPVGCPRYIARVVQGLVTGPSPAWLQRRLRGAGLRSISNVVDVTNFVMLEYGHPIHAFDYDRLAERRIVVRRARAGETLVTLDGEERQLDASHLLICDGGTPIALAGIMGGRESEVEDRTSAVLLECAWFDPVTVRRGARSLAMRTEASIRFERGIDVSAMGDVAARACSLMAELAGGAVAAGAADEGVKTVEEVRVGLRPDRVRRMLADDLSTEIMEAYLGRLGFDVRASGGALDVGVPPHRHDIETEADLIEEIARIHGYDRIEAVVPYHELSATTDLSRAARGRARDAAVGVGLTEVLTSSFVTPKVAEMFGGRAVGVRNPVNKETPLLRTSLLPGALDVVLRNRNVGIRDVRVFEIGKVFELGADGHVEGWRLAGALTGARSRFFWDGEASGVDFYDGKGVIWAVLEALEVDSADASCYDCAYLSSDAGAGVHINGHHVGVFGMLSREAQESWGFDCPVFVFELNLDALVELRGSGGTFEPLPRYPRVCRDLALVVSESTDAGSILAAIDGLGEKLLTAVEVFDVYRGDQLGPGRKSLAFSLTYMSRERTLTDREVDGAHQRIVAHLANEFGATLRE